MKSSFIPKFLAVLADLGGAFMDANRAVARVKYKGFSYKSIYAHAPNKRQFKKGVTNLRHRGLITDSQPGYFRFTSRGASWRIRATLQYFKTRYPKWDGKWRIILFDIPSEFDRQRVKFRRKLRSLGCTPIQKSVFAFPYPCEDEIGDIASNLKLNQYVNIILAYNAGYQEEEIRKQHGL